ncbi:MAG TPA: hypothetical protein VGD92_00350 [Sphingobacteriaceae bacterium]
MTQTILYLILYAVFNVSGAAMIKNLLKGRTLTTLADWLDLIGNVPFLTAFVLIAFSALALFKALSTQNFTLIIPLATGINFILTIGVGYFIFNDRLSMLSLLGFILIVSGILVLSINNQTHA